MARIGGAGYAGISLLAALVLTAVPYLGGAKVRADSSAEQPFAISSSWPAGIQRFLRLETSPTVFNMLYHWGKITPGPAGAYGPNVTAPRRAWYIEYQRAGNLDVTAGVLHGNAAMVADGLKMFHFGLAREAADGSFPGSFWPFHGTAMFLAESAPSLIVLRYSPMETRFDAELKWQIAKMQRAAYYMVHAVGGPGRIDDHSKNHRFYEASMALASVATLADNATLIAWSKKYVSEAMRMERPDGVMPEDGGHDTGYQALGMMHATRYLALVATRALYNRLYGVVQKGENWELSRVRPDGTVDQSADTRTTGCRERDPTGKCKTTFYDPIFNALARWSVISGDTHFERAAYSVWLQNWRLVPGDVLPAPGLFAKPTPIRTGDWLTVWGTRFQPLEVVKVYFGDTLEQTITCDQIGSFGGHSAQPNAHFPIPSVSAGRYVITARGSFGTVRHLHITVTTS